jgi:hypothetical protein
VRKKGQKASEKGRKPRQNLSEALPTGAATPKPPKKAPNELMSRQAGPLLSAKRLLKAADKLKHRGRGGRGHEVEAVRTAQAVRTGG